MFVHMFNKVYFINKSSEPQIKFQEYITFSYIENYIEFKKNFPTLETMYNSLSVQSRLSNKYNGVHAYILEDEDFVIAINDYCSLLNLDKQAVARIIRHSNNCELYMENCDDLSLYNPAKKFYPEDFNIVKYEHKIRSPEIFPSEFFINCLDNQIAVEKFTRFKVFELYNLIKNIQYSCIRKNLEIPEELKLFIRNDNNALLLYNKNIFDNVIKFLNSINIDTTKFTASLDVYLNLDPDFGYNQYHIYKYNFPLAKYFKETGYRII